MLPLGSWLGPGVALVQGPISAQQPRVSANQREARHPRRANGGGAMVRAGERGRGGPAVSDHYGCELVGGRRWIRS